VASWRRVLVDTGRRSDVQITKKKNDFVLTFPEKMNTDLVGTEVVIPGDGGKVLLSTSLRHSF